MFQQNKRPWSKYSKYCTVYEVKVKYPIVYKKFHVLNTFLIWNDIYKTWHTFLSQQIFGSLPTAHLSWVNLFNLHQELYVMLLFTLHLPRLLNCFTTLKEAQMFSFYSVSLHVNTVIEFRFLRYTVNRQLYLYKDNIFHFWTHQLLDFCKYMLIVKLMQQQCFKQV